MPISKRSLMIGHRDRWFNAHRSGLIIKRVWQRVIEDRQKKRIASTYYLPLNTISHCRQARLSLVTRLHSTFSHKHRASYQRLSNRTYVGQDDCYSHILTTENGWYHAPVLTSKYAITLQTSTSYIHAYICNSVHFWTKRFSSRPS